MQIEVCMKSQFLAFVHSLGGNRALTESIFDSYLAVYPDVGRKLYEDCASSLGLLNDSLFESTSNAEALEIINGDAFDTTGNLTTDYPIFMASVNKSKHPESLSAYGIDEYAKKGATLYKFRGLDAGYAIDKDGDIITVHNNSGIGGLGRAIMDSAKRHGGKKLDHFDIPHLTNLYSESGFKENERLKWDDQYAPSNWNYEKHGRPDVIMRSL